MKVILRQNFEKLGAIGDVVDVKDGYAMNFLIPRKIAYTALKGNLNSLEEEKRVVGKKMEKELKDAEAYALQLEKVSLNIPVQVGEEDKIFGSVTNQMIADSLKEKGYDVDKRKIELDEPIKTLGLFMVNVKLHPSVTAKIQLTVERAATQD